VAVAAGGPVKRLIPIAALVLAGCTLGPDYVRPPVPEPDDYRQSSLSGESVADMPWWELFGDPVLQDLIRQALGQNRDLRAAHSRVVEAEARLGIVRADLHPRVNYGAGGTATATTVDENGPTYGATAGLSASYIVDLWGRIRRSNEAAVQDLLATEEGYRSVTIALVAETARSYLLLRDLDNRLSIAEQTVETRTQSLTVLDARLQAGAISEVDRNQAVIQLAEAEASVETFRRLRVQTENTLSVLLGSPPMSIPRGAALEEQVFPPQVPTGLPSELLERRPDILAAENQLHAQTARIGAAEALKFPQFTLSADMGADVASTTTGFLGLGANLFGPLFNSGENSRRVDVEKARTEQLLAQYEQTILNALREVEDAMVSVETYRNEYAARKRQLEAADRAMSMTWARYDGGMTSYLEVLDVQRSLFGSQLAASETLQLQLTSTVRLYEALGGGWTAASDSIAADR